MNQMMGSSATALSEMFNRRMDITPPDGIFRRIKEVELREVERKQEVVLIISNLLWAIISTANATGTATGFAKAMVRNAGRF